LLLLLQNLHVVPCADLPASVDWTCSGVLSPVRSQDKVSSCWAFVTAEMIETGLKIFRGETVAVSTQFVLIRENAVVNVSTG
jgi:C1A family cysteine protease